MRFKLLILIPVFFIFYSSAVAQTNANLEAGLNIGLASFQTDFGERGDFKSGVTGNVGLALGGVVYVNFFNRDPILNGPIQWGQKHLKLKVEVSYLRANLEHFGRYVEEVTEDGEPTVSAEKLKNMTGKSSVFNFGTILEYHPIAIPTFVTQRKRIFEPYFGLGVMAGLSKPTIEVAGGDWEEDRDILIEAYQLEGAVDDSAKTVLSLVFSGGLRHILNETSALQLDMRWQYFANNHIDGLDPDTAYVPNNHNDWLYYLNFGYIYTFGPESKVSTWFLRRRR